MNAGEGDVIADFEVAEKMLDFFIKKSTRNRGFLIRPRIVIGISSGLNSQKGDKGIKLIILKQH